MESMKFGAGLITLLLFARESQSYWTSFQNSPATFRRDYESMVSAFKIYSYNIPGCYSSFTETIRNSTFVTNNPHQAHLFFIPCHCTSHSPRSLSLLIQNIRTNFPFWNRTLGADHFCVGAMPSHSDRNLLELAKNSIHLSSFPDHHHNFVPHKDIALPPLSPNIAPSFYINSTLRGFGYAMLGAVKNWLPFINQTGFVIESEPADECSTVKNLLSTEYCAFEYSSGVDFSRLGFALRAGCIPVIIAESPIQSLPFLDVLRWSEIALFVKPGSDLRRALKRVSTSGAYKAMRIVGAEASRFFFWHQPPKPYDAFHMVMYQLWLRRHTIKYSRTRKPN